MAVVAACFQPSAGSSTVTLAFFARRPALILLSGALSLKEAYDSIEWPILILLGAFIPVSEALRSTGATDLVAGSSVAMTLPPIGALTMMLVAAMAITPFLNTPPRRSSSPRFGLSTDPPSLSSALAGRIGADSA